MPEQAAASNSSSPDASPNNGVDPPTPGQIRRELDPPSQATPAATAPRATGTPQSGPGDSPPLSQNRLDLLNDGIADQQSRRVYRYPILIAAVVVLTVFTLSLAGVVATLSTGFYQALKPENIAKSVAVELQEAVPKVLADPVGKPSTSSIAEKASSTPNKESNSSVTKTNEVHVAARETVPVKIEAKIYGEVRDSMVPLVALVSILAVAIVVILGTMLKAAFAPHPNNSTHQQEKDETSPVPILEAIKGLVDSIKEAWK